MKINLSRPELKAGVCDVRKWRDRRILALVCETVEKWANQWASWEAPRASSATCRFGARCSLGCAPYGAQWPTTYAFIVTYAAAGGGGAGGEAAGAEGNLHGRKPSCLSRGPQRRPASAARQERRLLNTHPGVTGDRPAADSRLRRWGRLPPEPPHLGAACLPCPSPLSIDRPLPSSSMGVPLILPDPGHPDP